MLFSAKHIILWLLLTACLFIVTFSIAQRSTPKGVLYGGLVMGAGWIELSSHENPEERTARFGLSLYGGIRPLPWLRTGISLGGWTIESYDYYNYWEGISISNIFGQVQVFPFKKNDLYLNVEGGWSKYINQHPDVMDAKGSGGKIGLGYEQKVGRKKMALNLSANYSLGRFKDVHYPGADLTDLHYDVYELMLGLTFR